MSDLSISTMTMSAMALDSPLDGAESLQASSSTILSGVNRGGPDSMEQSVAGTEIASRTSDYIGTGADFSSTGTDIDIQQAISSTLMEGTGTITDKVV